MKQRWRVEGFDSTTKIFETTFSCGQFTLAQIKQLLKALTAKASLEYSEIVGAYATRRTKIANNFLDVRHDSRIMAWRCGNNPHFMASIIDEAGKAVKKREL